MAHQPDKLSLARNLKIGLFHLGSGMADVLVTGIWNRVMISDLGFAATPVSLLASLRYFLAPLSVWAGRMSDRHAVLGYHRLFWIWSGRALMASSMVLLGYLTAALAGGLPATAAVWSGITAAMLMFSLGNALSGSTFLALIYDRTTPDERGRAVGIVWTFLLTGFAVGGAFFATLLPEADPGEVAFTPAVVRNLFLVATFVMSTLWVVSLVGEEARAKYGAGHLTSNETVSFKADLNAVYRHPSLRAFMLYLALSMAFSFSQDAVLEPFAGDVFGMSPAVTTRFAAYWGTTAILGSVAFIALSRRFPSLSNTRMSQIGVLVILATFALYVVAALANIEALMMPGLLSLGLGLGMWNIGTLGLMMEMSPDGRAGTFLGFWTLVVTLSRGVGVSGGGITRDVAYVISNDLAVSYAAVFGIAAVGLVIAYIFLIRTDTAAFQQTEQPQPDTARMLGAALD